MTRWGECTYGRISPSSLVQSGRRDSSWRICREGHLTYSFIERNRLARHTVRSRSHPRPSRRHSASHALAAKPRPALWPWSFSCPLLPSGWLIGAHRWSLRRADQISKVLITGLPATFVGGCCEKTRGIE